MKTRDNLMAGRSEIMRVSPIFLGIACVVIGSTLAFAQTATSSNPDQKFVDFAAQTDMLEAHLGQMAVDQASGQNVKDFAQMLVTDHTSDYQQLNDLSAKTGIAIPKGIDAQGDKMIATFEKLKGAAFDKRFAHEMISGHEKAIDVYKREISSGQNTDVKAYASRAMPVLEKHLQGAKELQAPHAASATH